MGGRPRRLRGARRRRAPPTALGRSRSRSAAALAALAIGLSPAGAKVGDLVSDVVGIGEQDAKPALRSLPAAGELLVESEQGAVDRARRRLEAAARRLRRGELVAARALRRGRRRPGAARASSPTATCAGRSPRRATVHDPRWARDRGRHPDRLPQRRRPLGRRRRRQRRSDCVARDVSPVPPAWRPPPPESKLAPGARRPAHVLTYVDGSETDVRTVDVDTGERRADHAPSDRRAARPRLPSASTTGSEPGDLAPTARRWRRIDHVRAGATELVVIPRRRRRARSSSPPVASSPARPGRPTAAGCSSAGRPPTSGCSFRPSAPDRWSRSTRSPSSSTRAAPAPRPSPASAAGSCPQR